MWFIPEFVVIDDFCFMYLLIIWLFWSLHRRFYRRSLLCDSLDYSLIDKIPGRQNDRKTLLGELNWIFTAVTDTIAWNVLPRGSCFWVNNAFSICHLCTLVHSWRLNLPCRSFSEVVQTRFVSCQSVQKFLTCWKNYAFGKLFADFSPNVATNPSASYVVLEEMLILLILRCVCLSIYHYFTKVQCRDAWDMAAEICLSQLPSMVEDPNSEFQVCFSGCLGTMLHW
jgi:hypothetical protein